VKFPDELSDQYARRAAETRALWDAKAEEPLAPKRPEPTLDERPTARALAGTPDRVLLAALEEAEGCWDLEEPIDWDDLIYEVERSTEHDFGSDPDSAEIRALRRWVQSRKGDE